MMCIFLINFWNICRGPRLSEESSLPSSLKSETVEEMNISVPTTSAGNDEKELEDEGSRKKRKHEEKKREKHEKRDKRHSRDSDDKRKHKKHKEKRRYDSD